jgi:hypothetical protein
MYANGQRVPHNYAGATRLATGAHLFTSVCMNSVASAGVIALV